MTAGRWPCSRRARATSTRGSSSPGRPPCSRRPVATVNREEGPAYGAALLLYGFFGDPSLPARVYTAGQALFDARNPVKLLDRTERPFLRPTEAYERTGQYPEGTTFVEGLVRFNGRWFLYYGSADSRVGVAVSRAARP